MLYSLPVLPTYFLIGPLYIVQGIYAKYFGLPLQSIAMVLLLSRLFDAISDPVIGSWVDRYYSRVGSRKPFMVAGGLLLVCSSWFLYVPPDNVSVGYFLVWFLIFYLAYTLFEIPHLSWANELAPDSKNKSSFYAWRAVGMYSGSLLFFAVPFLPVFENHSFTPETLKWSVLVAGLIMGPFLYVCLNNVPNCSFDKKGNGLSKKENLDDVNFTKLIFTNTPLLWFLLAFFCAGLGVGMWFSMIFLYVESYLGLGEKFALVYVVSIGISIISLGLWPRLASALSKKRVWQLAMLMIALGLLGTGELSLAGDAVLPLLLCMTTIYCGFTALNAIAPSILGDIIDYGFWEFGKECGGIYFSIYTLTMKGSLALGGAIGLGVSGWYGFNAMESTHAASAVFGLHLVTSWLPAVFVLVSILFIEFIPINSCRHKIAHREVDSTSC